MSWIPLFVFILVIILAATRIYVPYMQGWPADFLVWPARAAIVAGLFVWLLAGGLG